MPSPGAGSVSSLSYMAQFLRSKKSRSACGGPNTTQRGVMK
jgi:hypothetical protein